MAALVGKRMRQLAPEHEQHWYDISAPALDQPTKIIDRQVNHLVRLVDDLLDLSRTTRGKITLQSRIVSVNDVLRALRSSCPSRRLAPRLSSRCAVRDE